MNILLLLTPKAKLAYLTSQMSIRQALEKMRAHGYAMIPLIDEKTGKFLGNISEGDLLWHIIKRENFSLVDLENENIITLLREDMKSAVSIDASLEEVFAQILNLNYVAVVDDRGILVGIITRRSILTSYLNKPNSI